MGTGWLWLTATVEARSAGVEYRCEVGGDRGRHGTSGKSGTGDEIHRRGRLSTVTSVAGDAGWAQLPNAREGRNAAATSVGNAWPWMRRRTKDGYADGARRPTKRKLGRRRTKWNPPQRNDR